MDNDSYQQRLALAVDPFLDLLRPLLERTVDPETFQDRFLDRYLNRPDEYDDDVFAAMDKYFSDVEEFVADPRLRQPEQGELGPEELLASTRELLQRAGML